MGSLAVSYKCYNNTVIMEGNVAEPNGKGGYGKRPLWQWILIYVVVGGIIYAGIYYFYYAKNGGYKSSSSPYQYNTK